MGEKMDKEVKRRIENILVTDEESSDSELVELFVTEHQLSKKIAEKCVAQRGDALVNKEDFQLRLK